MKTFEELLKQETIEYCVSGHGFDSAMTFEEMIQFYKSRNLRENGNAVSYGSRFYLGDSAVINVHSRPKERIRERIIQAQELGIGGLKTHVSIHP